VIFMTRVRRTNVEDLPCHICPPALMEKCNIRWTDFHSVSFLGSVLEPVDTISVRLNLDKNKTGTARPN
jgi:hypothetical protein